MKRMKPFLERFYVFFKYIMQISAAITEKCIFSYSSVNITDSSTIRVSTLMFLGLKKIKTFLECVDVF